MAKHIRSDANNHFNWGDNCQGWHFFEDNQISVIKEIMPPRTSEVKHYHQKSQQIFHIIEGEACFDINKEQFVIPAGESIHIAAGETHQIKNNTNQDLIFLVISSPPTTNDRVEE